MKGQSKGKEQGSRLDQSLSRCERLFTKHETALKAIGEGEVRGRVSRDRVRQIESYRETNSLTTLFLPRKMCEGKGSKNSGMEWGSS